MQHWILFFAYLSLCGVATRGQISGDPRWTEPTRIPDAGGSATGNVGNNMAILSTGVIVLVYNQTIRGGGVKLYITRSTDDGRTWEIPGPLSVSDTLIGSAGATIAADIDDVLHLTWTAKVPEPALYYSRSVDGGLSWSSAVVLYRKPRYKIAYHSVTVDRKKRVHVSWHDGDTDDENQPAETWYIRSVDQGEKWDEPYMLSTDDGWHSAFARSDFSAVEGDTLLYVWRDNRAGGNDWDIYGAFSYDGGNSWQERPIAVGPGRQWDPMAMIDKHGTIHVGIMEYPAGHQIDVYVWYIRTSDGGATWSEKQTIRGARTIFPFYTYDYTHDIIWYFLRLESPPGPNPISDLGVRFSIDGGRTWGDMERLTALKSGGTKFPAIVTGSDGIVRVCYSLKDSNGLDRLYYQKRIQRPSVSAVESGFSTMEDYRILRVEEIFPNPMWQRGFVRCTFLKKQRVQVILHDAQGLPLAMLFDGYVEQGRQTLPINVSQIFGGVYYLEVKASTQRVRRKIIIK